MTHVILLGIVGLIGGTFGSMVGLGGGVFIIPALTLFLGVPIHSAISASLIAVVATSTTAAAAYVREDLSNMRLGMTMETMTVSGALVGGFIGASLSKGVLSAVFGSGHGGRVDIHGRRETGGPRPDSARRRSRPAGPFLLRPKPPDGGQLQGPQTAGRNGGLGCRRSGLGSARRGGRVPQGARSWCWRCGSRSGPPSRRAAS